MIQANVVLLERIDFLHCLYVVFVWGDDGSVGVKLKLEIEMDG